MYEKRLLNLMALRNATFLNSVSPHSRPKWKAFLKVYRSPSNRRYANNLTRATNSTGTSPYEGTS
jgi:hypothetical protein